EPICQDTFLKKLSWISEGMMLPYVKLSGHEEDYIRKNLVSMSGLQRTAFEKPEHVSFMVIRLFLS
ncbi:MAG: hypothetical protein ACI4DX_01900, partial [Oliverpabstia sp.]